MQPLKPLDLTARFDTGPEFRPRRERDKSFVEILRMVTPFKRPASEETHALARNFGVASTMLRTVDAEIRQFLQQAYAITSPPLPQLDSAGLEVAMLPFEEAFAEYLRRYEAGVNQVSSRFEVSTVGRVEWPDRDKVLFTYFDVREETGLLRWQRHRTKHRHELVKAVSHPLAEPNVPMDRRARQLAAILPPSLKPHTRVITGLQIQRQQEAAGKEEGLTRFGEIVHGSQQAAHSAADSARRALSHIDPAMVGLTAAGIGAVAVGVAGLGSAMGGLLAVALADPALAIGEFCLHGWDE